MENKNKKDQQINFAVTKEENISLRQLALNLGYITVSDFFRDLPNYLKALFEHLDEKDDAIVSLIEQLVLKGHSSEELEAKYITPCKFKNPYGGGKN